ncbi:unnamed protein product [Allacma fusca]|uniref:CCHC-type domain-containing protein n=1 Tax=Allacma fusca TaxID=39272 RepID=A0A8J2NKS1_9HEXA|nr:unnamed protein product [Allacma fusca]
MEADIFKKTKDKTTKEEARTVKFEGKCFYCDRIGHMKKDCNNKKRDEGNSQVRGKLRGRAGFRGNGRGFNNNNNNFRGNWKGRGRGNFNNNGGNFNNNRGFFNNNRGVFNRLGFKGGFRGGSRGRNFQQAIHQGEPETVRDMVRELFKSNQERTQRQLYLMAPGTTNSQSATPYANIARPAYQPEN